jgi:hypothetical protein
MKNIKKPFLDALFVGLVFVGLASFMSLFKFIAPPELSLLENFEGTVLEYKRKPDTDIWRVKSQNDSETLTFFIIEPQCECFDNALKPGALIQAKLDRRFWFLEGIRAWELKQGFRSIVSIDESVSTLEGDLLDWLLRIFYLVGGATIIFTPLLYFYGTRA